jgi:hypothetical protein
LATHITGGTTNTARTSLFSESSVSQSLTPPRAVPRRCLFTGSKRSTTSQSPASHQPVTGLFALQLALQDLASTRSPSSQSRTSLFGRRASTHWAIRPPASRLSSRMPTDGEEQTVGGVIDHPPVKAAQAFVTGSTTQLGAVCSKRSSITSSGPWRRRRRQEGASEPSRALEAHGPCVSRVSTAAPW